MKYQGIVFDKDGTLLDFNRSWLPVYRYAAQELAEGDAELAEQLLTQHGFDPARSQVNSGRLLAAGNNNEIVDAWAWQISRQDRIEEIGQRLQQLAIPRGVIRIRFSGGLRQRSRNPTGGRHGTGVL